MKKSYIVFALLLGITVYSQTINIPNANFKNTLVNTICVDNNGDIYPDTDADTNNNGEIEVSEALAVIVMNVNARSLTDVTGLEEFTNLQVLFCEQNSITQLPLSTLQDLELLYCRDNSLNSLDLSNPVNLMDFGCDQNQ